MREQRPDTGILFRNDKKEGERDPHYRGELNVGGVPFYISLWVGARKGSFCRSPSKRKDAARTVDKSAKVDDPVGS
jgi:hypothetical protein